MSKGEIVLFENFETKEEIARFEKFLLLTQCFQLTIQNMSSFREIFHTIVEMFSKSFAADLSYVVKGVNQGQNLNPCWSVFSPYHLDFRFRDLSSVIFWSGMQDNNKMKNEHMRCLFFKD